MKRDNTELKIESNINRNPIKSSKKGNKLKLIKGIPSKNPRNFDSEAEIDEYLNSLDIKEKPFWECTNTSPEHSCFIRIANNGDIWSANEITNYLFLSINNGDTWTKKGPISKDRFWLSAIAISPVNNHIFISSKEKGLFKSTDTGESWVNVTNDIKNINNIIITTSEEIYLTTRPKLHSLRDNADSRIYYSNDNGNTWLKRNNGLPKGINISSLAIDSDGNLYIIITSYGIYRSTDKGNTWSLHSTYVKEYLFDLAIAGDDLMFAATVEDVVRSKDNGVTWQHINKGLNFWNTWRLVYNPITRHLFASPDSAYSMVHRSTNLGESWELMNSGLQQEVHPDQAFICDMAFNPITGQMYAVCGGAIYKSKNYPK